MLNPLESRYLGAAFAAALALGSAQGAVAHDASAETVRPVMKQSIPEAPGKNVLIAPVSYAPGQASEAHMHPGSIFAHVVAGHVVSQLKGSPPRTYGPGESWYEPPDAHHVVSRNASDTEPAQLVVFAVAGDGESIKKPLPR